MKRTGHLFFTLFVLSIVVLGGVSTACSHGTGYKVLQGAMPAAVQFQYSDGEPMSYAEVQVFSPKDRKMEHQNGRTDGYGKFAFCPTMPGAWVITANDGMGHLCEATVKLDPASSTEKEVTSEWGTGAGPVVQGSKTLKIIAGLSLILNMALVAQILWQRSKKANGKT